MSVGERNQWMKRISVGKVLVEKYQCVKRMDEIYLWGKKSVKIISGKVSVGEKNHWGKVSLGEKYL